MINPRILVSHWSVNGHKAPLKQAELTVTTSGEDHIQITLLCPLPNGSKQRMRIQLNKQSALELAASISPTVLPKVRVK